MRFVNGFVLKFALNDQAGDIFERFSLALDSAPFGAHQLSEFEYLDLRFGGQVMKNVAGFDVSRLMAGSLGTLAVILEVSLKVLPLPVTEVTLRFEVSAEDAIRRMNEWAGRPRMSMAKLEPSAASAGGTSRAPLSKPSLTNSRTSLRLSIPGIAAPPTSWSMFCVA